MQMSAEQTFQFIDKHKEKENQLTGLRWRNRSRHHDPGFEMS